MSKAKWEQVKDIFTSALEIDESERNAFVIKKCAQDADLRAEVESWLGSYAESEDFIETPAFSYNEITGNGTTVAGRQFGNYRVIREIGHGGMGAVFLAERTDGEFSQKVAIKIIRQAMADTEIVNRFKRERQILATLNHQNIARLLDGGVSSDGMPFLAMEFVDGESITKFSEQQGLDLEARLKLFLKVCSAISYAHRNLIVHRDLKPSNILVTAGGEPKLLDFGLAKLLDENLSSAPSQTQTALRALTPAYASPEQLKNEPITTSSDIYSLGVVLYELLTNERPYRFEGKTLDQIIKTVDENEPQQPSANQRSKLSNMQLKGDLDNIVLAAMRSEPERRYLSVEAFAEDIERHLQGLPVNARPNTFRYRTVKFVSRNKVGVIASSIVLLSLIATMVISLRQTSAAERERDKAQQERIRAEQINTFLQTVLSAAAPEEKGRDAKVLDVLNDAAERIETEFADQPETRAQALYTIGRTYNSLGLVEPAEKCLRAALSLGEQLYGEENRFSALAMILLGDTLNNRAKTAEAKSLLIRGTDIERRLSPLGSQELALGLFVLGEINIRANDSQPAIPLLQESIAISDSLFGNDNPESAYSRISLGRAQERLGDLIAAESSYLSSIRSLRGHQPKYAIRLATALLNLGNLRLTNQQFDEAILAMNEGHSIFEKNGESFELFVAKSYLARAYTQKRDYDKALSEALRSIDIAVRLQLEETPDFVFALTNAGSSLTQLGQPENGESYLRRAAGKASQIFPERDLRRSLADSALGECLLMLNKFDEASPLLVSSYENILAIRGEHDPATIEAKKRLDKLREASH